MHTTTRNTLGFTLIELMMTLAVIAILIACAAPAFGNLVSGTGTRAARSNLVAALNTARILAASKTAHVVVCPSADGEYCGHTTEWQHGWLVFVDANRDDARDPGEELLAVGERQPEGVAIVSTSGRTHVDYRPDGITTGSHVTFTVCDRRGAGEATALVINNAGRVRSGEPTAAAATACETVLDDAGA